MLSAVGERIIRIPVRTVLAVLGLIIAVWVVIDVISIARHVLIWIAISVFLALAINPLVDWLQERGVQRRSWATGLAFLMIILAIVALGALFIPTLIDNVNKLVDATPGAVHVTVVFPGANMLPESGVQVTGQTPPDPFVAVGFA